jgi:hypothetical protein
MLGLDINGVLWFCFAWLSTRDLLLSFITWLNDLSLPASAKTGCFLLVVLHHVRLLTYAAMAASDVPEEHLKRLNNEDEFLTAMNKYLEEYTKRCASESEVSGSAI